MSGICAGRLMIHGRLEAERPSISAGPPSGGRAATLTPLSPTYRLHVKKKCEGFPIGTSLLSRARMGDYCNRVARYVMPFGRTFGIALPAPLISRPGCFAAISPTFPALGRLKQLAARVWLLLCRSASTSRRDSLRR